MNASARVVEELNRGDTNARYAVKSSRPTRPVYAAPASNQAVNELAATLKHIVANAVALLGVRSCWIAGLDPISKTLIPIASLSQGSPELNRARLSLHQRVAGWVIANRTPALINDTLSDTRCQGRGPTPGGSMLSLPLLSAQQLLGTITVSTSFLGAFDQQALRILQTLADQTVLAVSRARQMEASLRQEHQLAALLDVARAMTSTLETPQMLQAIVAAVRQLVPCDEAVIFGYVEEAQELRAVARLGVQPLQLEELRIPMSDKQSIAVWVAQKRRPILHGPGGRVFVGRVTEELLGEDDLALLGVPLLSRGRLKGVAILARAAPFDTSELRAMLNLGSLIAAALEHAGLQHS